MSTSTNKGAARQRKPLSPVTVTGRFLGGATARELVIGAAILSVFDETTRKGQEYWAEALVDGDRIIGVRLVKFGSADRHECFVEGGCNCQDATYRPDRPGGCRHVVALKQALPTLIQAEAKPGKRQRAAV